MDAFEREGEIIKHTNDYKEVAKVAEAHEARREREREERLYKVLEEYNRTGEILPQINGMPWSEKTLDWLELNKTKGDVNDLE